MYPANTNFRTGVISPIDCLSTGWSKIKDQYWILLGISFIGIIIGSIVPMGILLGPMMCGIHMCYLRAMRRQPVAFDVLFKGFDVFVPSLIVTLIQIVPMIIAMVLAYVLVFVLIFAVAASGVPEAGLLIPIAFLLFFLVIMALAAAVNLIFFFAYQLVADRGMQGFDAIKLSARAAMGNLGGVIGLLLLGILMGIGGMLLCYVGTLFIMPIAFAMIDEAYERVFPSGHPGQMPELNPSYQYQPRA